MNTAELVAALATKTHRPVSLRRLAELKGVSERAVRKAIESGRLPEPIELERTTDGTKPQRFFLWSQVRTWSPGT